MTKDQLNATCIWHACVTHHDNTREDYYFWEERDLISTIHTTWSKRPSDIVLEREGMQKFTVYSNDLLHKELVHAERICLGQVLHDKPTHF